MKVGNKNLLINILIFLMTFILPTFYTFLKVKSYYLNIFVWLFLFVVSIFLINNDSARRNIRKSLGKTTLITVLIYVMGYFFLGLIVGYAKNPLTGSFILFVKNFIFLFSPYIFRELLRNRIISNSKSKFVIIMTTIVFVFSEINTNVLFNLSGNREIFEYFFGELVFSILENGILSFYSYTGNIYSVLTYIIPIKLKNILLPILPDLNWFIRSLLLTIYIITSITIITAEFDNKFLKIRQSKRKKDKSVASTFFVLLFCVLFVLFIVGRFEIYPTTVLSNSMKPIFNKNDVTLMKKVYDPDKLEVGDIIRYRYENYYVIHRIIEKNKDRKGYYFITKGDNNEFPDTDPVYYDQVHGIYVGHIYGIGGPVVWLNEIINKKNVSVEKGE